MNKNLFWKSKQLYLGEGYWTKRSYNAVFAHDFSILSFF